MPAPRKTAAATPAGAEVAVRTAAGRNQYRDLFDRNPVPMWIYDKDTLQFLAVNDAAVKLYGYSRQEFLRLTVKDVRPPEEVPKLLGALARLRAAQPAFVGIWRHRRKDGSGFDAEVTISCIHFQGRDARLTMVNDITERKQAEELLRTLTHSLEQRVAERTAELEAVNKTLREEMTRISQLESEILKVSEREQRRIGRDLHDGLCQITTATAMLCEGLERDLRDNSQPRHARTARRITRLIQSVSDEARRLSQGLSPVSIEAEGLMDALVNLALSTKRLFRVNCTFHCDTPVLLGNHAAAIHLFRIAQEAVNNAVRHSKSKRIQISLQHDDSGVQLAVADNGRGIPGKAGSRRGMGLHVMRYRAHKIGASLNVDRQRPRGTVVRCHLPLRGPTGKIFSLVSSVAPASAPDA